MSNNTDLEKTKSEMYKTMRVSRVVYPIVLGIGVVGYLLYHQFDIKEFNRIEWQQAAGFWILMAVLCLCIKHLAYSVRLYLLSEGQFTMRKCIELIFIWEFSSAVSPTSVGGSAVALVVLSQEKLSTAKTTTIVLYTVVLDTLFFISTIPVLYFLVGPSIIRPGMTSLTLEDGWGVTFVLAYSFMALYGAFFFYALFLQPQQGKSLLGWIANFRILSRWKEKIMTLGEGFVEASQEIWKREPIFHVKAFLSTMAAWSMRFLIINCLILAIVPGMSHALVDQFKIYARLEAMFVILAFSPTPGGAGFHEYVFGGFLTDYVPKGISVIVAFIWRLITYYSYLLAGVIIIPNWLRNIIKQRRERRDLLSDEPVGD